MKTTTASTINTIVGLGLLALLQAGVGFESNCRLTGGNLINEVRADGYYGYEVTVCK